MKIAEAFLDRNCTLHSAQPRWALAPAKTNCLGMVTCTELTDLQNALVHGEPPLDFAAKLSRMAGEDLGLRFIEQNCRLFISLLTVVQDGSYTELSPAERDRLLRVLAYVRKDDDRIPDYRRDGYVDDQEEVRAAVNDLSPVLRAFKDWRLRNQVPGMWLNHCVNQPAHSLALS
jgi:hypothetical protein